MPSLSDRDPRLYLEDMVEFCSRALDYADGLTRAGLVTDRMRYDAILRNLELIGEAVTHVDLPQRAMAPQIPWRQIIATRNRVGPCLPGY